MSGRARLLLSPRDWAYVLALLVPFALLDLTSKMLRLVSLPADAGSLVMLRSDLLFHLGYALLWVGLFAVARRGLGRLVVVVLFHAATVVVALVSIAADRFYGTTGSALDFGTISFFLSSPKEVWTVVASEVTPTVVLSLFVILAYAVLGPWLVARLADRGPRDRTAGAPGASWLGPAGLGLLAYALVSLSALPASGGPAGDSLSRDAFVNVALTGIERSQTVAVDAREVRENLPTETSLNETAKVEAGTKKRNVVLISLESTRARSMTPYNPDIETTPFLDDLSKESVFAERAYTVVPHTTNALTASLCGIDPPTRPATDSLGDRVPARCLPKLLGERGYRSAFFQSATEDFERRPEVVENMGFEEFYSLEDMDKDGFERANYFGYEDDIMLKPSENWLRKNGDRPFFVAYNTITPHHQYLAPGKRYGRQDFAEDDTVDRYQNSVRYMDFFVKNLIQQYKDLGLYENTVFVIQGDHGEAFGEHGRFQHDNVIWNEGLRIPLMVLDPKRPAGRVETPVNELDVLPTVVDALGYEVEGGSYPGRSLLEPLPKDRTLMASCWYENKCLASVKGDEKYIYHFGSRPDEFYDLSEDPLEKNDISGEKSSEELKARREELLEWRARADAAYAE